MQKELREAVTSLGKITKNARKGCSVVLAFEILTP